MTKKKTNIITGEYFAAFIEAKKALDKKIEVEGIKALTAFFQEFFEKRPDVYGVKWTQHTPYFNDGEPCVFGLDDVYLFFTKESFESEVLNYDNEDAVESSRDEQPTISLLEIENILESAFGDHAAVSVTRTEITTEGYESHE